MVIPWIIRKRKNFMMGPWPIADVRSLILMANY